MKIPATKKDRITGDSSIKPETRNQKLSTHNSEHETSNQYQVTSIQKQESRNQQRATSDKQPASRNQNPASITASIFILLFVYTAISKLQGFHAFRLTLSHSPLLGNIANVIAIAIPVIELIVATLLFIPKFRRWGLLASLVLMTTFTIYIIYMLIFETHLPCSCGGVIQKLGWRGHLWFNSVLTVLALIGYKMAGSDKQFFIAARGSRKPVEKSRRSLNF